MSNQAGTVQGTATGNGLNNRVNGFAKVLGEQEASDQRFQRAMSLVQNSLLMRRELMSMLIDPRRNIDQECGYPTPDNGIRGQLNPEEWQRLHDFDWLAGTVNSLMANECFQSIPEIIEDEDPEVSTELERSFYEELPANMGTEPSHYRGGPEMHPVWAAIKEAWIKANISRYGVLYVGFNDRRPGESVAAWLQRPVEAVKYKKAPAERFDETGKPNPDDGRRVLFFRSFPEHLCRISNTVSNELSLHHGEPEAYDITFADPMAAQAGVVVSDTESYSIQRVHASRCIHICPNDGNNPWVGHPECESVIKPIYNIQKMTGAHSEGMWKMAFNTVVFESQPDYDRQNVDQIKESMEQWEYGLQRAFSLIGFTAKTLPVGVTDPKSGIDVNLRAISVRKRVPKRILEGSEIGQANSEQDKTEWKERVREFFYHKIVVKAIIPLVNRLINVGALARPKDGYVIKIPPLDAQTQSEKVNIASVVVNMLVSYIQGGGDVLIPPKYLLTTVLRGYFTDAEVDKMLEEAEEQAEKGMGQLGQMGQMGGAGDLPGAEGGDPGLDGDGVRDAEGDEDGLEPTPQKKREKPKVKTPQPSVNLLGFGSRPIRGRHLSSGGKPAKRVEFADEKEFAAARKLALSKIKNAPKPTREDVMKARRDAARAGIVGSRVGGEARGGNTTDRKAQRINLFNEAGGKKKGYVVCPWTGVKMHWTDDPAKNPKGYPSFERGKIFVKSQGGGYQLKNLIAESYLANRTRGGLPLRR